jgi:TonB family protein
MLFDYNPQRQQLPRAISASMVLHCALIALVVWICSPRYLHESASLRGKDGDRSAIALVSLGISAPFRAKAIADPLDKRLRLPTRPKVRRRQAKPVETSASAENKVANATPGSQNGSLTFGLTGNHDVRIAYTVFAPDPPIERTKLPEWIRGDVVVEVAINEKGDVVETRVLKSLGFGLEDVIVDTLRRWRYQPAKVDGVPVASKHDVYFHFPS